jgi:membrane-bound lytic murein transglycosylase B
MESARRRGLVLCLLVGLLLVPGGARGGSADPAPFAGLQRRLAADGFSAVELGQLFRRPEVSFDIDGVSLFFRHTEARAKYERFTSEAALREAADYQRRFTPELAEAERRFGVEREVITGILLVETWLGTYLGKHTVFNTLATMATLSEPGPREAMWDAIPPEVRFERALYDEKVRKKSGWAYSELKALLTYAAREDFDPLAIRGSYAGAMGICQFMPSNALRLARDGNRDGRVDLFAHGDAIASVAHYLQQSGWKRGLAGEGAVRVILRYNYSRPYADTVLTIAERLRG